jgi:hypothetical protein
MNNKIKVLMQFLVTTTFCNIFATQNLLQEGKDFLELLYAKPQVPIQIPDNNDYLDKIVAIMHYLCSKVPEKNDGEEFSSGSIVIEDKDWKLHTFLKEYVAKEFGDEIKKEIWISTKDAYPRHSTHFNSYYLYTGKAMQKGLLFKTLKKTSPDYFHYGIDLKKHQTLPIEEKRHILCGKIGEINDKKLMFVKFEKVGLKSKDAFEHALELIKYKIKDQIPALQANLLEKLKVSLPEDNILHETLSQIAHNINPKDSLTKYRRETVPLAFMGEYMALMFSKESKITDKKLLEEIKEKAKALGIQEIVKTVQDFSKSDQGTQKWRKALAFLAEEIKKQYPDDWTFRFGNEIILLQKDFVDKHQVSDN